MAFTVVEYLLSSILKDGLDYFKTNPQEIEQVLLTHDTEVINRAKYIVQKLPVKVLVSYPRSKFSLPLYVVFLEGEEEDINYIGDKTDPADNSYQTPIAITNEVIEVPDFQLTHKPLDTVSILCNGIALSPYDFSYNRYTGRGHLIGNYDPSASYTANYTYFEKYYEPIGAMFRSVYRIECLSNNIEEVLILYRLAQFVFMSNRTALSHIGFKNQSLSGEDLEPVNFEDQPDFIFRRALYFTFTREGTGTIPLPALQNIEIHPV